MKRKLTAGQTSVSLPIFIQDTASTTGGGLSGLTSGTSGLVAEYRRRGQSAWTTITLTSKTLGTWTSGGFVADGALGGAYELDLPNAVCASGERWVAVRLRGAANMLPCLIEIELDVVDYQVVAAGANTTTPPTAAANAAQVRTELATELARIDAAISTRSTFAGGAVASVTGNVGGNVAGSVGSVVAAVELDSTTISAVKSGLATSTALADVQTDVDAANNYLSALSGVFSGITSMANWLRRAFRKDAGTAGMNTAETEINSTGGAFAGTADSLEAIRDNQSAGGGTAPTIVTLQSVAGISPGVILGPTEPLVIGDDYLTSLGRSVRVNLLDSAGEPAEVVFGDKSLADAGVSIQLLLARSGKPTTVADLVGTCTFFPAVGEIPPYLMVEFTRVETAKAIPGPYDMQAEAVWSDGKVVTFAPYGQVQFVKNIRRVA